MIKRLWPFIRAYKSPFLNLYFCVLVTSLIGMVYPYIFGLLVDEVFYHRNLDFFVFIVIGYGILYLGEQSLHFFLNTTWSYLTTRFSFDIRKKLYEKIISLRPAFFHNSNTGDLMTVVNRDADEAMNLIHWNIFYLTANIIRLTIAIGFVMLTNVYMGLIMIAVVPAAVFTAAAFGAVLKRRLDAERKQYGKIMSWCVDVLSGLRDIRLLGSDRYTARQYAASCIGWIRLKNRTSRVQYWTDRSVGLITLTADLIIYAAASVLIVNGQLTVGGFVALSEYFARANGLLKSLSGANARLQHNKVALGRVFAVFDEPDERDDQLAPPLSISKGEIVFRDVTFAYEPTNKIYDRLNLRITAGETIAIVGSSGTGKSTLASLLLRFYEPDSGDISIDGMKISSCSLRSLRSQIGIVQQHPALFQGTIRSNLLWGHKAASEEELWEACEKASIAAFIRRLPDGLDTKIGGEEGVSMSGGQKQRLAIARVFLKQPRIYIFDEATSALDGETEAAVKSAWQQAGSGHTTLIFAHRLSTIMEADRIAVLEGGRIADIGRHTDLIQTSEAYRRLFYEQYAEQEQGGMAI